MTEEAAPEEDTVVEENGGHHKTTNAPSTSSTIGNTPPPKDTLEKPPPSTINDTQSTSFSPKEENSTPSSIIEKFRADIFKTQYRKSSDRFAFLNEQFASSIFNPDSPQSNPNAVNYPATKTVIAAFDQITAFQKKQKEQPSNKTEAALTLRSIQSLFYRTSQESSFTRSTENHIRYRNYSSLGASQKQDETLSAIQDIITNKFALTSNKTNSVYDNPKTPLKIKRMLNHIQHAKKARCTWDEAFLGVYGLAYELKIETLSAIQGILKNYSITSYTDLNLQTEIQPILNHIQNAKNKKCTWDEAFSEVYKLAYELEQPPVNQSSQPDPEDKTKKEEVSPFFKALSEAKEKLDLVNEIKKKLDEAYPKINEDKFDLLKEMYKEIVINREHDRSEKRSRSFFTYRCTPSGIMALRPLLRKIFDPAIEPELPKKLPKGHLGSTQSNNLKNEYSKIIGKLTVENIDEFVFQYNLDRIVAILEEEKGKPGKIDFDTSNFYAEKHVKLAVIQKQLIAQQKT